MSLPQRSSKVNRKERETKEKNKGIEGQLEIVLDKFVSEHVRDSPLVVTVFCCFVFNVWVEGRRILEFQ